jgi:ABC-type amino acid transport substrate-binding protein
MRLLDSGRGFAGLLLAALLVLAPNPGGVSAAGGRLERISAAGELRVCIWPDYYGVTYRNPRSGMLTGIDAELSVEFARELGVRVRHVDSSFPAFIADLLDNRCDIAMFGVGALPERAERVRFSQPYLRSDILAVTTRTHPTLRAWGDIDRAGHVVGVQAGTFMEPVMRRTLRQARLVAIRPPDTRERELQAGRIDVFMTDYPYSRRLVDAADWARVLSPPSPLAPLDYAYAIAPGDDAWLARVDRFVLEIRRDGRLIKAARAHRLDPIVVTP